MSVDDGMHLRRRDWRIRLKDLLVRALRFTVHLVLFLLVLYTLLAVMALVMAR